MNNDYYKILGVSKNATNEEIKSAFRKLSKKYHPDINKDPQALTKFKKIQEAYAILSDENKRKKYNNDNLNNEVKFEVTKTNSIINSIKYRKVLLFIGIFLIFMYVDYLIVGMYYAAGYNLHNLSLFNKTLILVSKYIILILIYIIKDHKYLKEKWFDFIQNIKKYFEISFKNWFTGFLIMLLSNIIINYFVSGLGENESAVQILIKQIPITAFILTTILAPFTEEMVFRKSLKDCVTNKWVYMILSGLIFGLIHTSIDTNILELLLIIPYGALGFMFAKTVSETDNIYPAIMMHMLHNGILTLLAIFGGM